MILRLSSKTLMITVALSTWFLLVWLWPIESQDVSIEENITNLPPQEDLYRSDLTQANLGLLGVRFYESQDGKPRWEINSKFAELHRKENYAFLKTVTAHFFSETNQNNITSKSDYGRSWTDKNRIELDGNVEIQSTQGYLFWMNHLTYDGKNHEFTSNDTVNMKGPDVRNPMMFLKGIGLIANISKDHFILNHDVSAKKKLNTGDWLRITSKKGEFFTADSIAVFVENVVIKNKNLRGEAEKAILEVGGNQVVLEGKAKIKSDDNLIQGKRIKLYTDDDRIEVEEAEGKTSNDASR